jgi:hypothetical protein
VQCIQTISLTLDKCGASHIVIGCIIVRVIVDEESTEKVWENGRVVQDISLHLVNRNIVGNAS